MVNPFTATRGGISKGGGGPSKGDSPRESGGRDSGGGSGSFQEALKRGSAHAWKGRWEQAAEEYRNALKHSPKDVSARTYLAMALYKSGELQEALGLYQLLWQDQPSNPSLLQRMAEVQEAMGDLDGAAASFRDLAEIHSRRRALQDAFKSWQKAAALKPDDLTLWNSMMEAAALAGTVMEVMPSYLGLGRRLALGGAFEEAIGVVERAQILDPTNPLVLPLLASIRGALAYSWRATAQGETPTPQDLSRLIPEISPPAESPPMEDPSPLASSALGMESPPREEVPTVEVADEVEEPSEEAELSESMDGPVEEPIQLREPDPGVEEQAPVALAAVEEWALAGSIDTDGPQIDDPAEGSVLQSPEPEPGGASEEGPVPDLEAWLTDGVTVREGEAPAEPASDVELQQEPWDQPDDPGSDLAPAGESLEEAADLVPQEEPEARLTDAVTVREGEAPAQPAREEACPPAVATESDPSMNQAEPDELPQEAEGAESPEDAPGTAIAEQLAELAEAYERGEQTEQAVEAYGQALELSPHLARALLGRARLHLGAGELGLAEEKVRLALAHSSSNASLVGPAAKLLLDILIGKVVAGDLQGATEGLRWLRSTVPAELLPASELESGTAALAGLLGQCGAEHLDELALLSPEARGEVVLALRKGEELLAQGMVRSAIDEMYRLIAEHPSFLPAQSLLGKALAAQKRLEAARDRSQRLLQLYEIRGTPDHSVETLRWRVAEGISNGDDRSRLVHLLRAQNRVTEAELIEAQ